MNSPNTFAILTPDDDIARARSAFRLPENADLFHEATGGVADEQTIDSREATPAPPFLTEGEADGGLETSDRIILTFDKAVKNTGRGFHFGANKVSSDVFLAHRGTKGTSGQQFHITFNKQGWISLHDDRSSYGSAVSYSREKQDEVRKKEIWVLSRGPGSRTPWKDVKIHAGGLAFKIEFPNWRAGRPEYRKNLQELFEQSQMAPPSVDLLNFDSFPSTATPGQPQTPRQRPIYLDDKLIGKGKFGEVRRVIKDARWTFLCR